MELLGHETDIDHQRALFPKRNLAVLAAVRTLLGFLFWRSLFRNCSMKDLMEVAQELNSVERWPVGFQSLYQRGKISREMLNTLWHIPMLCLCGREAQTVQKCSYSGMSEDGSPPCSPHAGFISRSYKDPQRVTFQNFEFALLGQRVCKVMKALNHLRFFSLQFSFKESIKMQPFSGKLIA